MVRPIDEKIVAMKMDNSDFKRKAVETTGLFGKLTNALNKIPGVNLGKVTKDLGGIERAANNTDLSGLTKAIDNISSRFGALNVVATTALVNIANRAVDTGLSMMRSLGPEQIMSGFQEYELKMGSIGTMLANTQWEGASLDDVNRILSTLNDYADETIYNFAEMTASIGRFTAAGVKLEDSAIAIKGLGNLAAISGSDTNQLNTAMYQMSQMMAAGKMNLQDWNSLVNAGMAGKKTQDALLETAKAMGKNVDMSEGFRNSISDGWLTAEVFLETMKRFGEDDAMTEAATKVRTFSQMMDTLKEGIGSSWAESFEIIIGDFEEATKLWTAVSEFVGGIFEKQGKARNKMLRAIFDGDGLKNILEGIKNVLAPIGQLFSSIGKGFRNAFPPMSVKNIKNLVTAFAEWTEKLAFSEKTVKNLETIFTGFFSIFAIGWKIIKGAITVILELIPSFEGLGAKIVELISKIANIPKAFNDANDSTATFEKTMEVVKKVASAVANVLEFVVGAIILFVEAVTAAVSIIAKGEFAGGPWDEDSVIVDKLFRIRDTVVDVANAIAEAWSILTQGEFTGNGPWEEDSKIVDFLFKLRDGLAAFGTSLLELEFSMEPIANGFTNFVNALKIGYNWIVDKFATLGSFIKEHMPSGEQVFAGGFVAGMLAIVGLVLKRFWDITNIFKSWGDIGEGVSDVLESVGGALDSFSMSVKANALLTIAVAVGILAASFWAMSGLNATQIANGLYAIIGSLTALVGAMTIMSKYDITGTGMKSAIQIVALAFAFSILSGAIRDLSDMKWSEINMGLYGLIMVMGTFAASMALMDKYGSSGIGASAFQMIALAGSVYLLVTALDNIAKLNMKEIGKGLLGLGGILAIFVGGIILMSKFGGKAIGASALQFIAIAGSIMLMVEAIKKIAEIKPEALKTGLETIAYILLGISLFSVITSEQGLLATGAGLILLATALHLLLIPITALGLMPLPMLVKGLGAMAVALTAIGLASMLMKNMLVSGSGLILMATGVALLVPSIMALAFLPIDKLAIGIGALAIGILAIGGAAMVLGLAAAPLLLGAAGLLVLGAALLAVGAGIALLGTGLVTLAAMSSAAVVTVVSVLGTLIAGLFSLIPMAIEFITQIIVQMATAIAENAPVIAEQVWTTILAIMTVIAENAPLIYEQFLQMILGLVNTWKENMPLIVGAVIEAMTAMLNAIAERVGDYIDAGVNIILAFIEGIGRSISRVTETAFEVVLNFIDSMTEAVRTNGPKMTRAVLELMGSVILVVVDAGIQTINALFGWIPGVKKATAKIGATAEEYIEENFGAEALAISKGEDFASGLESTRDDAVTAAELMAMSAKDGLDIETSDSGEDFGEGFAGGMKKPSLLSKVANAAKNLAKAAKQKLESWLGIQSPSKETFKDGGWFGEGFALGILDKAKLVAANAKGLALTAKESLNKFLDGFELPQDDNEIYIKAIVDYDGFNPADLDGKIRFAVQPDMTVTNGLAAETVRTIRQQPVWETRREREPERREEEATKNPTIIQIVTPDKREFARWVVDDVTEFQELKMATMSQF